VLVETLTQTILQYLISALFLSYQFFLNIFLLIGDKESFSSTKSLIGVDYTIWTFLTLFE